VDGHIERRIEQLLEHPVADFDRIAVAAAFTDVRDEVLRRRDDARALERRDERATHDRRQVRILPIRLLDASPSHVVRDVDDRGQRLPHASRARLARNRVRDSCHECRVPRRREPDRLREHSAAVAHESVERLLEWHDRDAESRALDEIALDGVDTFGVSPRGRSRFLRGGGRRRRNDLQPEDAVRVVVCRVVQVARDHEQLPELLFERHAT
jgi:hypothetical protein